MNENNSNEIFGCFFNVGFNPDKTEQELNSVAVHFRNYIFGEKGISNTLKRLKCCKYGQDLSLILFEFNVNLSDYELLDIKKIGGYRRKEKSIGVPVIINEENFFSKSEKDRRMFLKESIIQKLDVLAEVVKKKKLDTNIVLLKSDLSEVLKDY